MPSPLSSDLPEFDCWVYDNEDPAEAPDSVRAHNAGWAAAEYAERLDCQSGGAMTSEGWRPIIHVRAPDDTVISWKIEIEFVARYYARKEA